MVRPPIANVVSIESFDVAMGSRSFHGASQDNQEWSSPDGGVRVDSSVGYVDDKVATSNIVSVESSLEMSSKPSRSMQQVPSLVRGSTVEPVSWKGRTSSTLGRGHHGRDSYVV